MTRGVMGVRIEIAIGIGIGVSIGIETRSRFRARVRHAMHGQAMALTIDRDDHMTDTARHDRISADAPGA